LVVAVSTDEFNAGKGKKCIIPFEHRRRIVAALRCVDLVIPELTWEQKERDVAEHSVDVFVIGDDWEGKFDFLKSQCEVIYMSRTPEISSTEVKGELGQDERARLDRVTEEHS
jgi:glycerol-3-phosphate cytidylyltransferase